MRRVNRSSQGRRRQQQLLFSLFDRRRSAAVGHCNQHEYDCSAQNAHLTEAPHCLIAVPIRSFGLYGTPAPPPKPDPSLQLGKTGTVKAPPSPFFKPASLLEAQGLSADMPSSVGAPSPLLGTKALSGTVVVWNSVDRKGIIEVRGGQEEGPQRTRWYRILSPRAFETIVPPHVRDLTGATVTHFMPVEATDGSHEAVRIYNKLVRPTFVQPTPLVPHKETIARAERSLQRRAHRINVASTSSIDRLADLTFSTTEASPSPSPSPLSPSAAPCAQGTLRAEEEVADKARMLAAMKASAAKASASTVGLSLSGAAPDGSTLEGDDDESDEGVVANGWDGEETWEVGPDGRPRSPDTLDIATQIIVDLSTAVLPKGRDLVGLKARDYYDGGMRPSANSGLKDLRNKTLFTKEELSIVAARQEIRAEEGSRGGPATEESSEAVEERVRVLAAQKLKEMHAEAAAVEAYKVDENDMGDLGIRRIDRNTVKFSFGGTGANNDNSNNSTNNNSKDANKAEAASFDEVLKSMRARMTSDASTSAAAAALGTSANTIIRTVHATTIVGKVVAWSQLHRTGLIVRYDEAQSEAANKAMEDTLDANLANGFIVRNVEAFTSAMPTAAALNGRLVRFTVVSYSDDIEGARRASRAWEAAVSGQPTADADNNDNSNNLVRLKEVRFAEDIVIMGGPIDYRLDDPEQRKAAKEKERSEQRLRRAHKNYIVEDTVRPKEAPKGPVFGVITRWSGGQGAVEASNGVVYYINNPKVFLSVVDTTQTSALRGAVVRFTVDESSPEYASTVEVISSAALHGGLGSGLAFGGGGKSIGDMSSGPTIRTMTAAELGIGLDTADAPASDVNADDDDAPTVELGIAGPSPASLAARQRLRPAKAEEMTPNPSPSPPSSSSSSPPPPELVDGLDPRKHVMHSGDLPPDDPRWRYGFIVTLSELEGQGIIQSLNKKFEHIEVADERGLRRLRSHQLGDRFLLRDLTSNVVNYNGANRVMIKKGRKVKFLPYGSSGRMATLVTPTATELTEEEVQALETEERNREEELKRDLTASEEALPGPTSGAFWMERLEGAGFDMREMKELKGHNTDGALDPREQAKRRANTMGLDEEDLKGDSFDPISILENDPWYTDKSKNIKIPGSDMRLGDVQKLSPSTMMGLATKAKNPEELRKTKDKYYNRLTEPQKEWAWNQAKQQAPLFEKRIKDAQLRGEEPKFSFF